MRKLEEARKKWETRHSTNSPFRADKFSASPLLESNNSPFTISKVFGMRHGFDAQAQANGPSAFMPSTPNKDFSSTFKH